MDRELDWESEITAESKEFIILPEGDYNFTINKVERSRTNGSDKLPPCNMVKVSLGITSSEGNVVIIHNLVLHSKVEWKLSEFFESLGVKKKGQPLRMRWDIVGLSGRCKVGIKFYNGNKYNEIKCFYPLEDINNQSTAFQSSGFNWNGK